MNKIIDILKKVGAIVSNDHFIGASGLHFDTYVNKDFLYPHTSETGEVCKMLADKYKDKRIETVVGPALGGIILSQWVAHHLSEAMGSEVFAVYTEKNRDGGQDFTRGYENYVKGKRVLVVEDVVTTGGSIQKVINAVQMAGGEVIGACTMINKNKEIGDKVAGMPFEALGILFVDTYDAESCVLCKSGVPINMKLGYGKKFAEAKK